MFYNTPPVTPMHAFDGFAGVENNILLKAHCNTPMPFIQIYAVAGELFVTHWPN